jgi:DNA-binding response OmpR family regulator
VARAGFEVEMAKNGFCRAAKLNQNAHAFQAIVTDLRMPGMDGFAFIEKSRAAGYTGAIVVYAGMMSADDRQHLRELGVDRVIAKSRSPGEIVSAIRQAPASPSTAVDS